MFWHCSVYGFQTHQGKSADHGRNNIEKTNETERWKWKGRVKKLAWNSTYRKLRSWHPVPSASWQINGEVMKTVTEFIFLGSKITANGVSSHEIKRHLLLGRKAMTNLDSILKSRNVTFLYLVKVIVFSSSHVWMWELDFKESWVLKNWCFWTVVLEKTWESLALQGNPTNPS